MKDKTFLILKYGNMMNAYRAWAHMTAAEKLTAFSDAQRQSLMDYKYNLINGRS